MKINLLKETLESIKSIGHKPDDIIYIGSLSSGYSCTWDDFEKLADFEYDNGFGIQEIAHDLEIIFSDRSGMYRDEYDGSESWAYRYTASPPKQQHPIHRLLTYGKSLKQVHEEQP